MGGIMLFVFKEGSRNAFDNDRKENVFRKNYMRAFRLRLPSMDAVEDLYRILDEKELETLKSLLVKELIARKVFQKFKFMGKRYFVSIDGTGIASYQTDYCGECTSKTSKNGKTTYFHNVLEAKLVTSNDMSISIATEWIRNENNKEYNKQDCELKAFRRLALRIKKTYPRLPLVILADGLYANQTFFKICQENGWDFIVTFKDGNLPSVHEEINLLPSTAKQNGQRLMAGNKYATEQTFQWVNEINYHGFDLSVINCSEIKKWYKSDKKEEMRFTHITNIPINTSNYYLLSDGGRMRWKIENSFDYLKNHGYKLGHKFSRVSFRALKNYYQSMMLAHMINQFVEKSIVVADMQGENKKCTIIHLWKRLIAYFSEVELDQPQYDHSIYRRQQMRLV